MKLFLEKKLKLLFIIVVIALIAVAFIFYYNGKKIKQTGDLVKHTQEVLWQSDNVLLDILNIETASRGYLITGNDIFLEPFNKSIKTINDNIFKLKGLTNDNSNQQLRISLLKETADERLVLIKKMLNAEKRGELNKLEKNKFVENGKILTDKIRGIIITINEEEFGLLRQRKIEYQNTNKISESIFLFLFILIGINILLVLMILRNQKIKNRFAEDLEKTNKLLQISLKEISDYKFALEDSYIIAITDVKGIINFANTNFCKISGYTPHELIGQNHRILNSGHHPTDFFKELYTTVSKGKIWRNEIKNKAKDGTYYWVDTTIIPFLNELGKPYKYVSIRIDITDRKEAQDQLEALNLELKESAISLKHANQIAENAVQSKQQFLSNMSHEIRTPMNAIIGFTKVVLKTDLTEKQKEYLQAIKISGDALIVLINDILDLAKVDAGKMTFVHTPFKLASSISAMLHLFETKIQEKNLRLVKEYDNNIPERLFGDAVRLHQIILNLISNAVKFTKNGTITVKINLVSEDDEYVIVEFAIEDTGIGIAENKLEKVFESFQQAAVNTSSLYGGTGLGLAIVKQLVEQQGGNVNVKSKLNEGSVFSFTLTFKKTNAVFEDKVELVKVDAKLKHIKVLVVEDIPLNQLLMKTLLNDFGCEYDIASNGKIAIEKLEENTYDIILMDLQMPKMNGFEATEYIRNTMQSKIPIIALTADVTTVDVEKCKAVGMNGYVAKPIDENVLYAKIISLVKN